MLEQVFIHGFFHADPHPGNVLVLPGNVLCFLDYGMMGMLTARQRELLSDLIIGLAARDERRIVQAAFQLSRFPHREHVAEVEAEIFSFCETHLYKPLKEIRVGAVLNEVTRILIHFDLHLPPEFFTLSKALATMEGVGSALSPDFDIMAAAEPFAQRLLRDRMSPKRVLRQLGATLAQVQGFLRDVPAELSDLFSQLKRGDVRMKFEHRGLENLTHALDQVSNRIAFAIVLAALLIGSALMVHSGIPPTWHGLPLIGVIGFSISGLMGFSLLYSILKHGKM
jgi:ubiquinone biosynthesis protein